MKKNIVLTSKFRKNYKVRIFTSKILIQQYEDTVYLLLYNPYDGSLNRHFLRDKYRNLESININEDYRIIFKEIKNGYLFTDIGNHDQLYSN